MYFYIERKIKTRSKKHNEITAIIIFKEGEIIGARALFRKERFMMLDEMMYQIASKFPTLWQILMHFAGTFLQA